MGGGGQWLWRNLSPCPFHIIRTASNWSCASHIHMQAFGICQNICEPTKALLDWLDRWAHCNWISGEALTFLMHRAPESEQQTQSNTSTKVLGETGISWLMINKMVCAFCKKQSDQALSYLPWNQKGPVPTRQVQLWSLNYISNERLSGGWAMKGRTHSAQDSVDLLVRVNQNGLGG